ncbi:MAG: hypothetical protein ACT4PT_09645, partial [Methanobacteriota archaeon]
MNASSGLFLALLGLAVARVRPRRRGNLALAAFCACFGVALLVNNLLEGPDTFVAEVSVTLPAYFAAFVALLVVGLRFPADIATHPRRREGLALASGAALLAAAAGVILVQAVASIPTATPRPPDVALITNLIGSGHMLTVAAYAFVLVLLAHRAAFSANMSAREAGACVLVSTALLLYPGVIAGAVADPRRVPGFGLPWALVLATVCALWLMATRDRSGFPMTRAARNVALLAPAVFLVGMIYAAAGGLGPASPGPIVGIARIAGVLVLVYAILRHQLLGLDVKVKWTLKQSTVAATFIAVFFVVSESASTFFAGSVGPYLGIAAAGLLVFAFAPLQHLAQRVADKAMPGVKAVGEMNSEERAAAYREMLRVAWRDGNVDKSER